MDLGQILYVDSTS